MAKPPTTLDRRLSPRNHEGSSPNAAALQGALLAFNSTPVRDPPRLVSQKSGVIMGIDRRDPAPILDRDSEPPLELPEPGSIKDKIAKFSSNSSSQTDIQAKSLQHVAAQLAVRNTPTPSAKAASVGVQKAQIQQNGEHEDQNLPSPIPVRGTIATRSLVGRFLDDAEETSLPKFIASPVPTTSPRPAVSKPRPNPPAPRKPALISSSTTHSTSSLAPTSQRLDKLKRDQELSSSQSSLRSKASSSTLSEGRPPALPPRRADSTMSTRDTRDHRYLLGDNRSPVRPSSSSAASLYSQSQNYSSSSMPDNLTDVSREGRSDAVVASSRASARALQAKRSPPPPPPSRRRRSRSLLQLQRQSKKDRPSNPSPGNLRQTLRAEAKSDDEGGHHRRHLHHPHTKNIIHKHPHKHHEGDRKRWRIEITEKERKRYEGVWAANKGLLIPPNQIFKQGSQGERPPDMYPVNALEMVVNLVVQDIWSRSRLPDHTLEQVWDLVDGQKIGLLAKEEFVVGMWLIDQQLKGHKLPAVVPDSVWGSVRRVPGISLGDLRT
ncbi:hypothetical protein ARAM_001320 [Aspergillus rambellii]|uniref:EH domain-containing protein n=1 Tax=Aspergillus rambellii TaxID=308745 RepID=A0A0F8UVS2_9EURO|nr:hypothetical protein ARAM_001320 [Aspergillus rambellii]